jgi:uncharacterized membrane protein
MLMAQKNRQALIAKPIIIIIIVAATVATMTSISVTLVTNAQQPQTSGSKSGTIASVQNGKNGMPAWILSGGWDLKNINSGSPTFNSTFHMVMLNGSEPHMHTIKDFKMTGSPTKSGNHL